MKLLIMIVSIFFVSMSAFGADGNFIAVDEDGVFGAIKYSTISECLAQDKGICIDMTGKDLEYHDVVGSELVINTTKKNQVDSDRGTAEQAKLDRKGRMSDCTRDWSIINQLDKIECLAEATGLK